MTISDALKFAQQRFNSISDTARLDAECLLGFALNQSDVFLRTWPDASLDSAQLDIFCALVKRRERGEPVAYILGQKQFWSLDLKVTADTLIPRPETELLVEQVLHLAAQRPVDTLLELGTGSGAIAIALASEFAKQSGNTKIIATDISQRALSIAKENAEQHQQSIEFIQSDWFDSIAQQQFDLIVSNPPYIERADRHLSQGDVRFEPLTALVSGDNGLQAIGHIIQTARKWLKPGGGLLLEHGYNQAEAVRYLFSENGYCQVGSLKDLSQNERISFALNN